MHYPNKKLPIDTINHGSWTQKSIQTHLNKMVARLLLLIIRPDIQMMSLIEDKICISSALRNWIKEKMLNHFRLNKSIHNKSVSNLSSTSFDKSREMLMWKDVLMKVIFTFESSFWFICMVHVLHYIILPRLSLDKWGFMHYIFTLYVYATI